MPVIVHSDISALLLPSSDCPVNAQVHNTAAARQFDNREAETDESLLARAQAVLHGKDDLLGRV